MDVVETILDLTDSEKEIVFGENYKRGDELKALQALEWLISDKKMLNDPVFKSTLTINENSLKNRAVKEGVYSQSKTWGRTLVDLYEAYYMKSVYPNYFMRIKPNMSTEMFSSYRKYVSRMLRLNESGYADPIVTFEDIDEKLKYEEVKNILKISIHLGQRKLLLSEVQFLTRIEEENPGSSEYTIVYAGAAPSIHTSYLSTLFPRAKFLLVDPNDFDIQAPFVMLTNKRDKKEESLGKDRYRFICRAFVKKNTKMQIINGYFTGDLAEVIREIIGKDTYFISDIRTNIIGKVSHTFDIIWNNCQQYNWIKTMEPVLSLLKFRHPFYNEKDEEFYEYYDDYSDDFLKSKELGLDFLENFRTKRFVYFDGVVNVQAFPGQASTESRLITDGKSLKDYGEYQDYEDVFCYYNLTNRSLRLHKNGNSSRNEGFDHCNDCALENSIWENYNRLRGSKKKVIEYVKDTNKSTRRNLLNGNHGKFFKNYTEAEILSMSGI